MCPDAQRDLSLNPQQGGDGAASTASSTRAAGGRSLGREDPFAVLPAEILALVFRHAAAADTASVVCLRLTHVCHRWRDVLLPMRDMWSDVRAISDVPDRSPLQYIGSWRSFGPLPHDTERWDRRCAAVRALFDLYRARAAQTLTHASILQLPHASDFDEWMRALAASAETLRELRFADRRCCTHLDLRSVLYGPPAGDGRAPLHRPATSVLQVVSASRELERLHVEFACADSARFCLQGVSDSTHISARPKVVSVRIDLVNHDPYPKEITFLEQLLPFFAELTAEMERFVFCTTGWHIQWQDWAWSLMLTRAAHLRSCHICAGPAALLGPDVATLPRLEELTLDGWGLGDPASQQSMSELLPRSRQQWCDAPRLRCLRTWFRFATRVECPSLRAASLLFDSRQDLDLLPQLWARWPQLTTLTIELIGRTRHDNFDPVLRAIFDSLSPKKAGIVHLPNLQHLGVLYGSAAPLRRGRMDDNREWAARDWKSSERRKFVHSNKNRRKSLYLPAALAEGLRELANQRALLCRGIELTLTSHSDSDSAAPPLRAQCSPLAAIKLGRVVMETPAWEALLDGIQARVLCLPGELPPDSGSPLGSDDGDM